MPGISKRPGKKWKAFLCFVFKTHTQICIYVFLFHTYSESLCWVWYTQSIVWRLWERLVCVSRGRGEEEEGVDKWMTVCGCEDVTAHRFHWWAGTGLCTKQAVHSNATVLSARVRQSHLWTAGWWESVSLSLPLTVAESSCSECICVCASSIFSDKQQLCLYLCQDPASFHAAAGLTGLHRGTFYCNFILPES